MKRWLRRFSLSLAVLFMVVAVFLVTEHFRGRLAFNHRLRELKARGENLNSSSLKPSRPPDNQNACLALLVLSNRFETTATNLDDLPPSLRFVEPGRAIIGWRLKRWNSDGKTITWSSVGAEIENARQLLTAVRQAVDWGHIHTFYK